MEIVVKNGGPGIPVPRYTDLVRTVFEDPFLHVGVREGYAPPRRISADKDFFLLFRESRFARGSFIS